MEIQAESSEEEWWKMQVERGDTEWVEWLSWSGVKWKVQEGRDRHRATYGNDTGEGHNSEHVAAGASPPPPSPPSVLPLHHSTPLHSTPLPPNFHSTSLTITLLSLLSINSPLLLTPLPPPLPSSLCPYELSYTELLLKVTKRPHPHTHTPRPFCLSNICCQL